MTRIAESQLTRRIILDIINNHREVVKYGEEVSSGYKVKNPGDSDAGGAISDFRNTIERIKGHKARLAPTRSFLTHQDDVINQGIDVINRARELASQAANETISSDERATIGREILALRDQMATLANSTYQGRYIFGGNDDDDPPFDPATYTNPSSGGASVRYVFDNETGSTTTRAVKVADNVNLTITSDGNAIWGNAINAMERLGRSLAGYQTLPASGTPDGTGNAYNLPTDYQLQTQEIEGSLDLLNSAMNDDLLPERVDIGARLKRLDTVETMLDATSQSAEAALNDLQNADSVNSITKFQQAQFALQASLQISSKVLNLSVLDFL